MQRLFDAADGEVEWIRGLRRKGWLPALRDAALPKVYAFGLRRSETVGLDLADFRRGFRRPTAPVDVRLVPSRVRGISPFGYRGFAGSHAAGAETTV